MDGLSILEDEISETGSLMLMSVKPQFSQKIFEGGKTVELRREFASRNGSPVLLYETSPVKKMSGYLRIKEIKKLSMRGLKKLSEKAGVDKEFIETYFEGKKRGFAIEIDEAFELSDKISLKKLRENGINPPQNYCYLKAEKLYNLLSES